MRGDREAAERMRSQLLAIDGVQSVTVNELIGSILVSYDDRAVSLNEVWSALTRLDCVPHNAVPVPSANTQPADGMVSAWAGRAVDALAGALVQKIAEVSVMTLVRALI